MHRFVYPKYALVRRIEVIHIQAAIGFYQQDPEQHKHEQTASHLKSIPMIWCAWLEWFVIPPPYPCMYAQLDKPNCTHIGILWQEYFSAANMYDTVASTSYSNQAKFHNNIIYSGPAHKSTVLIKAHRCLTISMFKFTGSVTKPLNFNDIVLNFYCILHSFSCVRTWLN